MTQTSVKDFGFGGGGGGGTIGDYIVSTATTAPEGYIEAGKVYNQSAYPDLYNCVGIVHNAMSRKSNCGGFACDFNITGYASSCRISMFDICYYCPGVTKKGAVFSCTNNLLLYSRGYCCVSNCQGRYPMVLRYNIDCLSNADPRTGGSKAFCSFNPCTAISHDCGGGCACSIGRNSDNDACGTDSWVTDGRCRAIIIFGSMVGHCNCCNYCHVKHIYTNDGGVTVNFSCTISNMGLWNSAGTNHCNCQYMAMPPLVWFDENTDKFYAWPRVAGTSSFGNFTCSIFSSSNLTSWTVHPVKYINSENATECDYTLCSCGGNCFFGNGGVDTCQNLNSGSVRTFYSESEDCTYIYSGAYGKCTLLTYDFSCSSCFCVKKLANVNVQKMDENYLYSAQNQQGGCNTSVRAAHRHNRNTNRCVHPNGSSISLFCQNNYTALTGEDSVKGSRRYVGNLNIKAGAIGSYPMQCPGAQVYSGFGITDNTHQWVQFTMSSGGVICCDCSNMSVSWMCMVDYDYTTQFYVPLPKTAEPITSLIDCSAALKYYIKAE